MDDTTENISKYDKFGLYIFRMEFKIPLFENSLATMNNNCLVFQLFYFCVPTYSNITNTYLPI